MDMLPYCELKFPFPVLRNFDRHNPPGWKVDNPKSWHSQVVKPEDYYSEQLLKYFSDRELVIQPELCMLFRGEPDQSLFIHIDGWRGPPQYYSCEWGFNVVWGSRDSEMKWYHINPDVDELAKRIQPTTAYKPYRSFEPSEVTEFASSRLEKPALIRIDIAHNVVNYDKENVRWGLTVRFRNKHRWSEIMEITKSLHA